jgi:hypothetical protein
MATDYTPKKFSIQQVLEVLLRDTETGGIVAYLDDLKTSSLVNEATLVYPTGGRGNLYIGGAFSHSRRERIEIKKATYSTELIAQQVGSTIVVGSNTDVVQYDVLTISGDAATPTFIALGTVGEEINFAYPVNTDGTLGTALTQDAVPATGKFSYTPGTNLLQTSGLVDGDKIAIAYNFNTGASAQTIDIEASAMPNVVDVVAYGLVKDTCTGELYKMQIYGRAQINPNWTWALDAGGEPAVEDFNLEFVKTCSNSNLSSIVVYNEEDAT